MAELQTVQPRLRENTERHLTDWPNEPMASTLKSDYDAAKPSHDAQMAKIKEWNDQLFVRGKARPPKSKDRSSVQPKLIRRQAEWRYSALSEPFLGSTKLFKVEPATFEDVEGARQNELLLNHQFRNKLNRIKLIDDLVHSTVDDGTCIVQTGWERSTTTVEKEVPVYSFYPATTEEQIQALQQAMDLKNENPRGYEENVSPELQEAVLYYEETQQPVVALITGTTLVDEEVVLVNKPTVVVHHPDNVLIDPSCNGDMEKALFVVVSFETNKAELDKQGDRYKNLDLVNWEGAAPVNNPEHSTDTPQDFQFKDAVRKKIIAYEYWGFWDVEGDGKLVPIVATWIGDVMIRMELNPFPDGKLPFVVIPYLPVKRELYGEPDAELLEDNQRIAGAVTRGMIDLMGKSANGQVGFAKGLLDPLNRRRYDKGQDYEFNPQQNPAQGMVEHKYPEIPASAMHMLNLQNQESEALTGVKSFAGGVSGEAYGDVAAGIRGALDAASKREMSILRRIAYGVTEIGKKINAMNAVFLSEKEVIRITNQQFVTIRREDLQGNFDLIVDIATAEVDDAKSKDLAFMIQTLGPNMDPSISINLILAEIADLKRQPELAQKLRTYRPEPSPEQKRLAELEVLAAEKEIEKLQSEIDLNNAKAQEALANKDQKNLDFLEQETGTKHARAMEQQQGQAKGNQDLQITKALTMPKKEGETAPNVEAAIGYNQLSDKLDSANTTLNRDVQAQGDPAYSLGSKNFDPALDPSLNPAINL